MGELSPFKAIDFDQSMLERQQEQGYVPYEYLPLKTRDGFRIDAEFFSSVSQAVDKKEFQCFSVRVCPRRSRRRES